MTILAERTAANRGAATTSWRPMNGLFFYIGLGLGLAAACGLRPFLPLLLAGALASSDALGVSFSHGSLHLPGIRTGGCSSWRWRWRSPTRSSPASAWRPRSTLPSAPAPRRSARGLARGPEYGRPARCSSRAPLAAHGDSAWPGILGGLSRGWPRPARVRAGDRGARTRLPDRGAREALTVYLDAASLLVAALVARVAPAGLCRDRAARVVLWRMRSRSEEKYAGLRILRR